MPSKNDQRTLSSENLCDPVEIKVLRITRRSLENHCLSCSPIFQVPLSIQPILGNRGGQKSAHFSAIYVTIFTIPRWTKRRTWTTMRCATSDVGRLQIFRGSRELSAKSLPGIL